MLDFALKVSRSAETVGEADFDVLKSHGFDEEDIWDIAAIAAFFGLSNRMAPCARTLNSTPWAGADTDDRNVFRTGRSADDQIGLEFDRELDEFVVRFAALPLSLNTPVPPREGIMVAALTPVANNASMRRR